MIWGLYAIAGALEEMGRNDIAQKYSGFLKRMQENSNLLFWNSTASGLKVIINLVDYRKPLTKENIAPTPCTGEV